jgi:hypothetical protein
MSYVGGCAACTMAFAAGGRRSVGFEIRWHPGLDILSAGGFITALLWSLRLVLGGQAVAAPVCSSWVAYLGHLHAGRGRFAGLGACRMRGGNPPSCPSPWRSPSPSPFPSPCSARSSFAGQTEVWLNRATSGRSLSRPLGRPGQPHTEMANVMVSRQDLASGPGTPAGVREHRVRGTATPRGCVFGRILRSGPSIQISETAGRPGLLQACR